jgi:hypothetical protein
MNEVARSQEGAAQMQFNDEKVKTKTDWLAYSVAAAAIMEKAAGTDVVKLEITFEDSRILRLHTKLSEEDEYQFRELEIEYRNRKFRIKATDALITLATLFGHGLTKEMKPTAKALAEYGQEVFKKANIKIV